ncbi:uncharacterized protein [Malus domestica]|uniref:uncharacterized protein n=1 Tax=Malus domestica TaxID=3750 RepID=UPI003975B3F0
MHLQRTHPEEVCICVENDHMFGKESFQGHDFIKQSIIMELLDSMQYCSAYIRREISIGNRCPHKNCMHDVAPAPLTFIGSRNEKVSGKLVTFAGPRAWTTQEVITLCERFAGQEANITRVPVSVLRVTRQLTRLFECTNDVADRLAFLEVDWEGKVVLIQCAKAMGIQKFVFYSIHNCDKHPEVPLMEIKYCTKRFPQDSCINHVIIRLCGFMQGIAYIRREISIGNRCPHKNCIHGHPDVAPLTFIGSRNEKVNGKLVTFAGPHAWTTQEVITLCERFAGQEANITRVPSANKAF